MGSSTRPSPRPDGHPSSVAADRRTDDVASLDRQRFKEDVRVKFADVFQVKGSCDDFPHYNIEDHRDDVSVVGRLSTPEVVKFFKF
jgi:hypothetical protein